MSWSCEVKVRNCVDPRNCAGSAKEMKKTTLKGLWMQKMNQNGTQFTGWQWDEETLLTYTISVTSTLQVNLCQFTTMFVCYHYDNS